MMRRKNLFRSVQSSTTRCTVRGAPTTTTVIKMLPPKDALNTTSQDILDFAAALRDRFRRNNIPISEEQLEGLVSKVNAMQNYQPRVAIFGKTGVGKSSLCNALFGEDVAAVSDTEACTRMPQEYLFRFHATQALILLDVPGVGESQARDKEYEALYASLLPQIDLLLWVVKSDDRALVVDERVWNKCVRPLMTTGCPVFVVVNQVDKLNPIYEWNKSSNCPGPSQQQLILERVEMLSKKFDLPSERIIPVSAMEGYNIVPLVESIVYALSNEKKLAFANAVEEEFVSEKADKAAKKGFFAAIADFLNTSFKEIEPYVPTIIRFLKLVIASLKA